jgi:hypothetical protein
MTSKLAIAFLALGVVLIPSIKVVADEPETTSKSTSPSTTTPSTTTTTPSTSAHKPSATNIINGKVDKISENSITIKVTYQTGKPTGHHVNVAHVSGGWLPRIVPGPAPITNPRARVHTVTQTMTFEISETPPVKVVTNGSHPTRTTGAYTDVNVGDLVSVGTHPVSVKNGDGASTKHTQVTGIDVLKNPGYNTSATTKPAKN